MEKYNGIEIDRSSLGWKDLCEMFPNKTKKEIEATIINGLHRVAEKSGFKFDEAIYTLTVKEVSEAMDIHYGALVLSIFNRWTKKLGQALGSIWIKGTGACEVCGVDGLEFWYYEGDDRIVKCCHCGDKTIDRDN